MEWVTVSKKAKVVVVQKPEPKKTAKDAKDAKLSVLLMAQTAKLLRILENSKCKGLTRTQRRRESRKRNKMARMHDNVSVISHSSEVKDVEDFAEQMPEQDIIISKEDNSEKGISKDAENKLDTSYASVGGDIIVPGAMVDLLSWTGE